MPSGAPNLYTGGMPVKTSNNMTDMDGKPIHVGDHVLCFRRDPDKGYPSVLISLQNGSLFVRHDDGGTAECIPDDPQFGVRKMGMVFYDLPHKDV